MRPKTLTSSLSLRLPPDLRRQLEAAARGARLPLTLYVRRLLAQAFEEAAK